MKYTLKNIFHDTKATIIIKDGITLLPQNDILATLEYLIGDTVNHGVHYDYAKRKLREIRSILCPHKGADCNCSGAIRTIEAY